MRAGRATPTNERHNTMPVHTHLRFTLSRHEPLWQAIVKTHRRYKLPSRSGAQTHAGWAVIARACLPLFERHTASGHAGERLRKQGQHTMRTVKKAAGYRPRLPRGSSRCHSALFSKLRTWCKAGRRTANPSLPKQSRHQLECCPQSSHPLQEKCMWAQCSTRALESRTANGRPLTCDPLRWPRHAGTNTLATRAAMCCNGPSRKVCVPPSPL